MYILGLDPTEVYASTDTPEHEVNTIIFDGAGNGYRFVKGGASTAIGANDVCIINESGEAFDVTATLSAPGVGQGLPAGVALATIAVGGWGWLQVYGVVSAINVGTSCAVHTQLTTSATAGQVDDATTAGLEVVEGLTTTAAEASNVAAGIASWPYIGRTL